MTLTTLLWKPVLSFGLSSLLLSSCGDEGLKQRCVADSECKENRLCIEGYCQDGNYNGGSSGNDDNIPPFDSCETACETYLGACFNNQHSFNDINKQEYLNGCNNSLYGECQEDVGDGFGVPTRALRCMYKVCTGLELSLPELEEKIDYCWKTYKHQG